MQGGLTDQRWALVRARPNAVDYDDVNHLHYLGNYSRDIAVSLTRMMENAYDWEHLPYVHSSSFASIECLDSGAWGWRAKLGVPRGGYQLLDLRVDKANHYWVSTIFYGFGEGIEIHTHATKIDENKINVDVRFYLPKKPNIVMGPLTLAYMKRQYKQLYDEDEGLMLDRQAALDSVKSDRQTHNDTPDNWWSQLSDLDEKQAYNITLSSGRFVLRFHDGALAKGKWIVHSAICPHMLGPLDGDILDRDGVLTCPWHGYKFDLMSGESLQPQCGLLAKAPTLEIKGDKICLTC